MKSWKTSLYLCLFILMAFGLGAAPGHAMSGRPKADWKPCFQETGLPFECATVNVPLVHSEEDSFRVFSNRQHSLTPMVSIAMTRLSATDPQRRIGSLFLNPGGPGGSGIDFLLAVGPALYTDEVRARFDLVGFDPRGIARSDALTCFRSLEEIERILQQPPFPITPEEVAERKAVDLFFARVCDKRASDIIDYMTTADVARDLDLLRQAVDDKELNYAGFSYGSYLGVTYANLFPAKVGALVVDGVLDPIAWATGRNGDGFTTPFSTRLRSDAGAKATLDEFFRLCDSGKGCAFAGDSAARFAALAESLRAEPIIAVFPDGTTIEITYADFIGSFTLVAMYDSRGWPDFAQVLADIEALAPPADIGARLYEFLRAMGFEDEERTLEQTIEGSPGVFCSDTDNPPTYSAWSLAAELSEAEFGFFGPAWTWISSICWKWPGSMESRYTGPFNERTANPVLVTNTLYDPATRYEGAETVADLLPNSRLLTVEGWGHTTLFLSQCATEVVSDYLVNGRLPAQGTVCQQDFVPFKEREAETAASGRLAEPSKDKAKENRARIIPTLVPDAIRLSTR